MECGNCNNKFLPSDIKDKKQGLLSPKVKCPKCGSWLKKDTKSLSMQLGGMFLLILGLLNITGHSTFNYILIFSLFSIVVGSILSIYSFKISKWEVAVSKET